MDLFEHYVGEHISTLYELMESTEELLTQPLSARLTFQILNIKSLIGKTIDYVGRMNFNDDNHVMTWNTLMGEIAYDTFMLGDNLNNFQPYVHMAMVLYERIRLLVNGVMDHTVEDVYSFIKQTQIDKFIDAGIAF